MSRLLALALVASTALVSTAALAAPTPERVRGTVKSFSDRALIVHTTAGSDVSVAVTDATRYLELTKSSLDHVDPGSYIGTATKTIGDKLVALEVVIFPPSMRGTGEGHYAWDRISDTTLSGGATASTMTNGTVSAAAPAGGDKTSNSTMTNGTVTAAGGADGAKQITVTYKDGKQIILVPPTAPIVAYQPGTKSDVTPGSPVFVNGLSQDGKITANAVAVGIDGVKPPM